MYNNFDGAKALKIEVLPQQREQWDGLAAQVMILPQDPTYLFGQPAHLTACSAMVTRLFLAH